MSSSHDRCRKGTVKGAPGGEQPGAPHTRTVPSEDADSISRPSGSASTACTAAEWPYRYDTPGGSTSSRSSVAVGPGAEADADGSPPLALGRGRERRSAAACAESAGMSNSRTDESVKPAAARGDASGGARLAVTPLGGGLASVFASTVHFGLCIVYFTYERIIVSYHTYRIVSYWRTLPRMWRRPVVAAVGAS